MELGYLLETELLESLGDNLSECVLQKSSGYMHYKTRLEMSPQYVSEYLLDGKGPRYLAAKHFLNGETK